MGHFYELPKEFHPDFAFPGKKPNHYSGADRLDKYGKHLVAGYLVGGNIGVLRDVTGRYDATYNGGANEPVTKAAAVVGQYLDFSAASTNTSRYNIDSAALRALFDGTKPFTLVFHARTDDTAINTAAFAIDGTDDFIVYLSDGIDRRFRVFWRDVTPGVTFNQTGTKYQGTWNIYQYSFDGGSGHTLAINGDIVSTGSASASGAGPYSSGPAIAGWAGGSTQYYSDDLASVFIFNKDFSAQARDLANNLYRSLNPAIPLTYFIPSASGRTATLTKTLGGLTLSGSSTLDLSASLTKTLSALTLSSAASLDIDAQLNKSLSDLTLVSASTLGIQGSLSKALSDLTLDSTATVTSGITGTLEKTLQAISLSSTGALDLDSSVSKTLESLTLSGTATLDLSASLSKTLEAISLSSSAGVDLDAQVSVTLGDLTLSSDATVSNEVLGTLSSTLGSLSLSSTAVLDISASSSITLSGLSLASAGQLDISASFSGTLEDLTLSAFGGGARAATLNKTLGSLTLSSEAKVVLGRVGFYFSPGESSGDDLGFYDTSSDSSGDKIGFFNS